jgi:ketosteroid isomerase-like protein
MNQPDAAAVVRSYFDAWSSKNFDAAAALLDDELRVEGPTADYSSAADFVPALTRFGALISEVDLLAAFGDGDEAMMLYDLEVKRLGPLRVAEHFTVGNSKITQIRQILDTVAVRSAGMSRPGESMP